MHSITDVRSNLAEKIIEVARTMQHHADKFSYRWGQQTPNVEAFRECRVKLGELIDQLAICEQLHEEITATFKRIIEPTEEVPEVESEEEPVPAYMLEDDLDTL